MKNRLEKKNKPAEEQQEESKENISYGKLGPAYEEGVELTTSRAQDNSIFRVLG